MPAPGSGRPTVLIAMHSFTPVYMGARRPWEIGLLYNREPRVARAALDLLAGDDALTVGDNLPYKVDDATDYTLPVHGERRGLLHTGFEIRQDLIAEAAGQEQWALRMTRLLRDLLDDRLARSLRRGSRLRRRAGCQRFLISTLSSSSPALHRPARPAHPAVAERVVERLGIEARPDVEAPAAGRGRRALGRARPGAGRCPGGHGPDRRTDSGSRPAPTSRPSGDQPPTPRLRPARSAVKNAPSPSSTCLN